MRTARGQVLGLRGVALAATVALGAVACGGSKPAASPEDRVFYQNADTSTPGTPAPAAEWAYAPLDAPEAPPLPGYYGVALFQGGVHLSRPRNWAIRASGGPPNHRYVEYVSPHAYLFAIYELAPKVDAWADTLTDYEDQATKAGAELLGREVPMATANGQGLAFFLRRSVTGPKGPVANHVNEYVVRGDQRIVLLQIVHHGEVLDGVSDELRRVVETLEIL